MKTKFADEILQLIHEVPGISFRTIEERMKARDVPTRDVYTVVSLYKKKQLITGDTIGNGHGFYLTAGGRAHLDEVLRAAKIQAEADKHLAYAVVLGVACIVAIVALFKSASAFN